MGGVVKDYEYRAADVAEVEPWCLGPMMMAWLMLSVATSTTLRIKDYACVHASPRHCASSAEKGYLSAPRYMSADLPSHFEPVAARADQTGRDEQGFAVFHR